MDPKQRFQFIVIVVCIAVFALVVLLAAVGVIDSTSAK